MPEVSTFPVSISISGSSLHTGRVGPIGSAPAGKLETKKPETDLLRHRSSGRATLVGLGLVIATVSPASPTLKARETPDADVLAQLADLRCDELRNRHGLVLDERLLQQG